MLQRYADTSAGNVDYQRSLARSLLSELGRDGALQFCLENGWSNVAAALQRLSSKQLH